MGLHRSLAVAAVAPLLLLSACGDSQSNAASTTESPVTVTSSTVPGATSTTTQPETTGTRPETTTEAPQPTIPDVDRNTGPGGTNIFGEEWLDDDLVVLAAMDDYFDAWSLAEQDPTTDLTLLTELLSEQYAAVITERFTNLRSEGLRVGPGFRYKALLIDWRDINEALVISCILDGGTWETDQQPDDGIVPDPFTGGVLLNKYDGRWLISGVYSEGSEPCEF